MFYSMDTGKTFLPIFWSKGLRTCRHKTIVIKKILRNILRHVASLKVMIRAILTRAVFISNFNGVGIPFPLTRISLGNRFVLFVSGLRAFRKSMRRKGKARSFRSIGFLNDQREGCSLGAPSIWGARKCSILLPFCMQIRIPGQKLCASVVVYFFFFCRM